MDKKQLIYSILTLFLIGLIVAGGTFAYYSFTSNNKNISFNTSKELENYVIYNEGESKFVGDFKVSSTYTQGMHSTISLYKTSEASNVDLIATIKMDINEIGTNIKSSTALKWVVTSGTSTNVGSVLAQGNFIGVNNNDTLTLVPNIEVTTTETFYTIWIWLDENCNPSDELTGETLDVNVWTEINQVEGIDDSFEITRINANYQNINATIVNNKNKITSYAIITSNTEPDEWTSINTNNQSNVYNLDYTVSETGTYYVWVKDSGGNTISRSIEVTSVDTTAPSCTWGTFNPTIVKNNVTSDIELTCTDSESSISYGNLKTSDITASNNYITVTNIRKTSITNGNKYIITITGSSTDGTSTLTLPSNKVKNAVGLGNNSVTSGSITIRNIIDLSGAEVTLNINNYTYTGSEIEPTVTVTLDGNTLVEDTDYEVTYSNNITVGEATITITGINDYEGEIIKHFNITYNSFNITLDNANATTNGTSTLYMRYLDGIYLDNSYNNKMTTSTNNITIPIRTGYSFLGYYDSTTQLINNTGYITSNFTNNLYNSAKTLNASWVDDVLPTGSLSTSFSNNTISVTVTASDNGSGLIESYGYRVSTDSTCNNTVTFTDSTNNTYTFNTTDTGTHYACVRIEDNAGNYNYISSSLNIISATFYYNSNATNGSTTISTKTVSCAINGSNCSVTIPTEVRNSVGTYNNAYAGLSTSTGNMTQAVANNATTATISGNSNYYSLYRTNVTNYNPTSTTATSSQALYRNQWFTSVSAMSDPVLSTSTTGTSNFTPSVVSGYSFVSLTLNLNGGGTEYTVANAAKTNTTTFYEKQNKTDTITATFYRSSNASGAKTNSTASGTRTTYLIPTSTSAATTSVVQGSITAPSSTAPYGTTLIGWATSASTMGTTTVNTANTTYYAVYRANVTNYYYASSYTSRTIYRNSYYGTATNYTTVLSTSNTGTGNYGTAVGPGSSVWYGLSTGQDTTREYSSVAAGATSTATKLYTVYQFSASFLKGANVSSVGASSGGCYVTTSSTACNVTLPSITPNSGFNSVGWNTRSGATTGTSAGSNYSIKSSGTKLYGNAIAISPTINWSSSSFLICVSNKCSNGTNNNAVSIKFNTTVTSVDWTTILCQNDGSGAKYTCDSSVTNWQMNTNYPLTLSTSNGITTASLNSYYYASISADLYCYCFKIVNGAGTVYSKSPNNMNDMG